MSAKQAAGDRSTGTTEKPAPKPKGGARPGAGRKAWTPTPRQRHHIQIMLCCFRIEDVAGVVGVDTKTLRRACPDEISNGKARKNAEVVRSLFLNATKHNNVSAQIYWTKTQLGWKETSRLEHTGKDGEAITYEERLKQLHESAPDA